jgi:hypothetical protein
MVRRLSSTHRNNSGCRHVVALYSPKIYHYRRYLLFIALSQYKTLDITFNGASVFLISKTSTATVPVLHILSSAIQPLFQYPDYIASDDVITDEWLTGRDLEEMGLALSRWYPGICLQGLKKHVKTVSQESRYPDRGWNRVLAKLKSATFRPACSVQKVNENMATKMERFPAAFYPYRVLPEQKYLLVSAILT